MIWLKCLKSALIVVLPTFTAGSERVDIVVINANKILTILQSKGSEKFFNPSFCTDVLLNVLLDLFLKIAS